MIQKNFILAYLLLVGLPLLGVFTVLDAGRGLVPPPSVSGEWDFTVDAGAAPNNCFASPAAPMQTMTLSQSGAEVSGSVEQPRRVGFTGRLEGNRLTGVASLKGPAGTCAEGAAIRWTATVLGPPTQRTLEGRFFFEACNACMPVAFRASRRSPLRKPGQ